MFASVVQCCGVAVVCSRYLFTVSDVTIYIYICSGIGVPILFSVQSPDCFYRSNNVFINSIRRHQLTATPFNTNISLLLFYF